MRALPRCTATVLAFLFVVGCALKAVQEPQVLEQPSPADPGTTPAAPDTSSTPEPAHALPVQNQPPSQPGSPAKPGHPQVSGSQRTEYVWQKMMEGVVMGGAVGGPFGAGGGLVVGLITGLLTADAHYADLQAKIQTEQAKDRELEAQIEREMERQRELEAELGGGPPETKAAPPGGEKPTGGAETKTRQKAAKLPEPERLASIPDATRTPAPSSSRPFKNVEVRDIDGDRVPDLWIYYNPLKPDEIIRQEEATKGDGRVNVWSHFKDGKLLRREVDTRGEGRPDTAYHYEEEKLVLEERDEKGEGRITYRAHYEDGRMARVEKSLRGDGKIDLRTYYDPTTDREVVKREERDLDGDGAVDIWSYYENGRLTRRDVSAAGLEHLSQKEAVPAAPARDNFAPPDQAAARLEAPAP